MNIRYDPEVDAAYIAIGRAVAPGEAATQVHGIRSPRGEGEIILDFDAQGHVIGIELLGASSLLRSEDIERAETV
ncbi:hypothetical protein RS85_00472 [Microbacterium sp. SA39]|nr:hypothetical protein RS85_00472 [Microbacterium sp. SA39]